MSETVEIEKTPRARPQFTNVRFTELGGYRMPMPAIVSILHRISGALLFLVGIPFTLYLLQQSISSEISFDHYRAVVSHWFTKLVLLVLFWAFFHHLVAGIRFLMLDRHLAIEKGPAKTTATVVLVVSLALTAIVALKLFGVF